MRQCSGHDHVDGEQDGDHAGRDAEHQECTADQLEPGDEGCGDLGEGDAHAGEALGDAGDPLAELLGTVGDEDDAEDDAEHGQADGGRCGSHAHDAKW